MTTSWKLYAFPCLGFIIALGMHLWHLNLPAQIVSDEVSFVNEGHDYVLHQSYFDPHPPLGKLQLGAVFSLFGFSPLTWRILNAVEGALIVPLLWWIVWRMTRQRVAASIVVLLALMDGFLLVESRLGMINVPYVFYSLMALAVVLKALEKQRPRWWLFLAGAFIGAAISVKWLGLMICLPTIALWFWPQFFLQKKVALTTPKVLVWGMTALLVVPLFIYTLAFQVHFHWLGQVSHFWSLNAQMLNYHLMVPATGDPQAVPWWGWLLAWRPFVYWAQQAGEKLSSIWSMPNPWIWWTGILFFGFNLIRGWRAPATRLITVLLLTTWLPFAFVHRIMYSYHAMPFDIILLILVAVMLGRWWSTKRKLVIAYLALTALVFMWFSPVYLNVPLRERQQSARQWLPSWPAPTQ